MAWVLLVVAGLFEVAMSYTLMESQGLSRVIPTVLSVIFGLASFACLALTLRQIPIGVSYALWSGIGVTGAAVVGMLVLGESRDLLKIGSLVLLVIAMVGLRLSHVG